jgi:GR25 family glycosyltransferase involved in LPS biosynthesis
MSIKIFVLTVNGSLRRPALINEVDCDVNIFSSLKEVDFQSQDLLINQKANLIILGRELSVNEKRTLLSHASVIKKTTHDWSIVLEDDAIVDKALFANFLSIINNLHINKPTIFLLYIGKNGVFVRKKSDIVRNSLISFHRCLALPSGAVSYAINSSAADILGNCVTYTGTADWPTWSINISFFGIFPQIVNHDFSVESIAQVDAIDSAGILWPAERYRVAKMFLGLMKPRQIMAYGGFLGYLELNVLAALYRRICKFFPSLFFRT